jgi:hypothetical protein
MVAYPDIWAGGKGKISQYILYFLVAKSSLMKQ